MRTFWLLLVDGTRSCEYRHDTIESARNEAARILNMPYSQGKGITVLQAVEYGILSQVPVRWESIIEPVPYSDCDTEYPLKS